MPNYRILNKPNKDSTLNKIHNRSIQRIRGKINNNKVMHLSKDSSLFKKIIRLNKIGYLYKIKIINRVCNKGVFNMDIPLFDEIITQIDKIYIYRI